MLKWPALALLDGFPACPDPCHLYRGSLSLQSSNGPPPGSVESQVSGRRRRRSRRKQIRRGKPPLMFRTPYGYLSLTAGRFQVLAPARTPWSPAHLFGRRQFTWSRPARLDHPKACVDATVEDDVLGVATQPLSQTLVAVRQSTTTCRTMDRRPASSEQRMASRTMSASDMQHVRDPISHLKGRPRQAPVSDGTFAFFHAIPGEMLLVMFLPLSLCFYILPSLHSIPFHHAMPSSPSLSSPRGRLRFS